MRIRLRVKEVAEAKNISMTRLSHMSFVSFNTVKSMMRDPFRPVSTDTLERLANALEVSIHDLIEEVSDENAPQSVDK